MFTVYSMRANSYGVNDLGNTYIEVDLTEQYMWYYQNGNIIFQKNAEELSRFPKEDIQNDYIAKVVPGKHSLVIPLGGKATLNIQTPPLANLPKGKYKIELTDISGITWTEEVIKP